MVATAMEDTGMFEVLIANKADPSIKNYNGQTADDIKQSKVVIKEKKPPPKIPKLIQPQLTPAELISKSPHMSPFVNPRQFISPQPAFFILTPDQIAFQRSRKSSNAATPNCFVTSPHLTPMAFVPQFFFPPDFRTNVAISPSMFSNSPNNFNELLNVPINISQLNQTDYFLSPSYNPNGYFSPCV